MRWSRKIILGIVFTIGITLCIFHNWTIYLFHLVQHQASVLWKRQSIEKILQGKAHSPELLTKLKKVQGMRDFAREIYNLKDSKSYSDFVNLERKVLGYNLTLAPEFSLEPVEFSFPGVGKFSYLGFFDEKLVNTWEMSYREKGYDTHRSEIGAYSTLGWFKDPLLSTYLHLPEISLARLIFHEISHEKIYFEDDSTFSESVSSFIERKAAMLYAKKIMNIKPFQVNTEILKEYELLWKILDKYRTALKKLYATEMDSSEKRIKKRKIMEQIADEIHANKKFFKYISLYREFLDPHIINNAMLLQVRRYSVQQNSLENWYIHAQNNPAHFLEMLSALKPCKKTIRSKFLEQEISWDKALKLCASVP